MGTSFAKAMARFGPWEEKPVIAVAFSGGSDSFALLTLLQDWGEVHDAEIIAVHIDHRLRPESKKEAQELRHTLMQRGVDLTILPWHHGNISSKIHVLARQARYDLLYDFCRNQKIRHLAIAHHWQDQLETFWMRLGRGSYIAGLSGMAAEVKQDWGRIIRPVLGFDKTYLQQICQDKNLSPLTDPSNVDSRFARGRLRQDKDLQEFWRVYRDKLWRCHQHIQYYNWIQTQQRRGFFTKFAILSPLGAVLIDGKALQSLPEIIAPDYLSYALQYVNGAAYRPSKQAAMHLLHKLQRGQKAATLAGCYIDQTQGYWRILREEALWRRQAPTPIKIRQSLLWDQRFLCHIPTPLSGTLCLQALGRIISPPWPKLSYYIGKKENRWPGRLSAALPVITDENYQIQAAPLAIRDWLQEDLGRDIKVFPMAYAPKNW